MGSISQTTATPAQVTVASHALDEFHEMVRTASLGSGSVAIVEAKWVRDIGPTSDGHHFEQEWVVTSRLDQRRMSLAVGDHFTLRQVSEGANLYSCLGITGISGRHVVMAMQWIDQNDDSTMVTAPLFDGRDSLAVLYPSTEAGAYLTSRGISVRGLDVSKEVASW